MDNGIALDCADPVTLKFNESPAIYARFDMGIPELSCGWIANECIRTFKSHDCIR